MRSTPTSTITCAQSRSRSQSLLSDVTEMSEGESGEDSERSEGEEEDIETYSSCEATSSNGNSTATHADNLEESQPEPELRRAPVIDIEPFDETPFSESFSGMFEYDYLDLVQLNTTSNIKLNDMSYNVDRITDIRELDSDFEDPDDDIDEIVVISRKPRMGLFAQTKPLPPLPPGEDTNSDVRDRKRLLDNVFSLSDFDFLDRFAMSLSSSTFSTRLVRLKQDATQRVYTMRAFRATTKLNWPFELRLLEMLTEQDCVFLPCVLRRIFEHQALFVVLDSYPAGNMLQYMLQSGALDPDEVLFYTSEIAEALSVIHDVKIQHGDINPKNIMIHTDGHIVLSGFDFAKVNDRSNDKESSMRNDDQDPTSAPTHKPHRGYGYEYEYRAPEVLLRWESDLVADCWGLGCLMYFMTFGEHPFSLGGFTQAHIYKQVLRGGSEIVSDSDSRMKATGKDLMLKCLERNPRLRPNIEQIKQHEYFASIDWTMIQKKKTPAPYIPGAGFTPSPEPNADLYQELFYQKVSVEPKSQFPHRFRRRSLDGEVATAITIAHAPYSAAADSEFDPLKANHLSCTLKSDSLPIPTSNSLYSLQARHSVQDLLPSVFRSPSLDELNTLKMDNNQASFLGESHPLNRAPSYESFPRSPVVHKFGSSREERLSLFWESLDKEVAPKPARVLGLHLSTQPQPQLVEESLAPPKLRRQRSTMVNNRLSQLVDVSLSALGNATGAQNRLRKLRRPKSTPVLSKTESDHDVVRPIGSNSRSSKSKLQAALDDSKYELPTDIKQIGSGIGFTYTVPAGSRSKSSICTPLADTGSPKRSRSRLPPFGLGLGLRLFTRSRGEEKIAVGPEYRQPSQDMRALHGRGIDTFKTFKMDSVPEDVADEIEAVEQDVFRCGSSWSMLPDETRCHVALSNSPCLEHISPVTATDSTVYSPNQCLSPGFSPLSPSLMDGAFAREMRAGQSGSGSGRPTCSSIASLRLVL